MTTQNSDRSASVRWLSPMRVDLGISVLDCSSRLVATARTRVYDKIRRRIGTIPARIKEFYATRGLTTPDVQLNLTGLAQSLAGHSASGILTICQIAEEAAIDEGVDHIRLMEIDVAGGSREPDDISMIPDLLAQCAKSEISLNLASSVRGGNARDLYATALVLLLDQFRPEASSRMILACNSTLEVSPVSIALDDISVESVNSVWPMMSAMRDELTRDSCYTDTAVALSFIGTKVSDDSLSIQTELVALLRDSGLNVSGSSIKLSIDAPGEGPVPAGIWCGLPLAAFAGAASSRAAALLLKERLSSAPSSSRRPVEADDLPITDSIRNIHAVSSDTSPADLAGSLLQLLALPVALGGQKYFKVVRVDSEPSPQGASLNYVDGTIPFLPLEFGWSPDHFSGGGLLLSPSR